MRNVLFAWWQAYYEADRNLHLPPQFCVSIVGKEIGQFCFLSPCVFVCPCEVPKRYFACSQVCRCSHPWPIDAVFQPYKVMYLHMCTSMLIYLYKQLHNIYPDVLTLSWDSHQVGSKDMIRLVIFSQISVDIYFYFSRRKWCWQVARGLLFAQCSLHFRTWIIWQNQTRNVSRTCRT